MRVPPLLVFPCLLLLMTAAASSAYTGDDWRPIDPAHLSMKTPAVEKDADAEVIFWDVRIDDYSEDRVFTKDNHAITLKQASSTPQ